MDSYNDSGLDVPCTANGFESGVKANIDKQPLSFKKLHL